MTLHGVWEEGELVKEIKVTNKAPDANIHAETQSPGQKPQRTKPDCKSENDNPIPVQNKKAIGKKRVKSVALDSIPNADESKVLSSLPPSEFTGQV